MKLQSFGAILFAIALAGVIYGLLNILDAQKHLNELDLPLALLSALLYLSSIALWNLSWGKFIKLGGNDSILMGFAAQLGGLTPFSLGADFLRGYFAKKAGKKFGEGMAASFAAKFHKIWIALVFSSIGIGVILLSQTYFRSSFLLGIGVPIIMLAGVILLTKNHAAMAISGISLEKISKKDARDFSYMLKVYIKNPQKAILGMLAASLALEFASFYLAFASFGLFLDISSAYLVFILLFFASKALFVPQGIGVTEIVGIIILGNTAPLSLIAAGMLLWNIVRIWIPTIIAGAASLALGKRYAIGESGN
ncbi:MAG: lysylphosphatidylglycerol synthase domain-containing protein [Candidatus Micrarchaeota archaeon]